MGLTDRIKYTDETQRTVLVNGAAAQNNLLSFRKIHLTRPHTDEPFREWEYGRPISFGKLEVLEIRENDTVVCVGPGRTSGRIQLKIFENTIGLSPYAPIHLSRMWLEDGSIKYFLGNEQLNEQMTWDCPAAGRLRLCMDRYLEAYFEGVGLEHAV